MRIERTTEKAERVLAHLTEWMDQIKDLECTEGVTVVIRTYHNGRENGYSVVFDKYLRDREFDTRVVWFSEFRSSDEIVVYSDAPAGFEYMVDNILDAVYERRKLFQSPKQAAMHCIAKLASVSKDIPRELPR